MAQPFIKVEEQDDGRLGRPYATNIGADDFSRQPANSAMSSSLMSRAMMTRPGFNSYDDNPNSLIDESDLLDLEPVASPSQNPPFPGSHLAQPGAGGSSSYGVPNLSSTPPIPDSTSPFDSFLLNQTHGSLTQRIMQPQQHHPISHHNRYPSNGGNVSASYHSPKPGSHVDRFMQENAIASNNSTPVGSVDGGYSSSGFGSAPSYGIARPAHHTETDKQQQLIERRRRRRESHNAVERRRRDNINEKIKELSELVPEKFLMSGADFQSIQKGIDDRPNKGTVLSRSVDYIRQLQTIIDEQNRAEADLQEKIHKLEGRLGVELTEFKYTSAELALSRLGIGPQIAGATPISEDLRSPLSSSSQASRPPHAQSSSQAQPTPFNLNEAVQHNSESSSRNAMGGDVSVKEETPDFTPEFDLDFYQKQGFTVPPEDNPVFEDDYYQ